MERSLRRRIILDDPLIDPAAQRTREREKKRVRWELANRIKGRAELAAGKK